jgi:hypothetical protein
MNETAITEAAATVQQTVGSSAYLHGINYDLDKWNRELKSSVNYMKNRKKTPAGV